jgi:hypothetical protein
MKWLLFCVEDKGGISLLNNDNRLAIWTDGDVRCSYERCGVATPRILLANSTEEEADLTFAKSGELMIDFPRQLI